MAGLHKLDHDGGGRNMPFAAVPHAPAVGPSAAVEAVPCRGRGHHGGGAAGRAAVQPSAADAGVGLLQPAGQF